MDILEVARCASPADTAEPDLVRTFDAQPAAPAQARRFVGMCLALHSLGDRVDEVQAVTSELVTNVLCHAAAVTDEIVVRFSVVNRTLTVEVNDHSPDVPRMRELHTIDALAENSRGMYIVASLTDAWSFEVRHENEGVTKRVRAEWHLKPGE